MNSKELIEKMDLLRHMVGADLLKPRKTWGYRNIYAPGSSDIASLEHLVSKGYPVRGAKYRDFHYYHATELGCSAIGLSKAATKRVTAHFS
jgi:hypothetical protein